MHSVRVYLSWFQSLRAMRLSALFMTVLMMAAIGFNTPLISAEELSSQSSVISSQTTSSTSTSRPATSSATTSSKPTSATKKPVITKVAEKPASSNTRASSPPTTTSVTPTPAYDTVSIPSIGFSSRFVSVGVTATNAVDVHPSLVGWWNGSARPGSDGAAFLDGHNPGVFSNLPAIKVGASITINYANDTSYTYKVVHREVILLVDVDMTKVLKPYNGAAQGLNLMTCMGAYNPATGTTDQRLIVYAVR